MSRQSDKVKMQILDELAIATAESLVHLAQRLTDLENIVADLTPAPAPRTRKRTSDESRQYVLR